MLRKFLTLLAAPVALAGCAAAQTSPVGILPETPAPSAVAGVAAGNDPRIGPIGQGIMRRGGSATDAAIAMALALAVVEPQSSGIGGGGFLVLGQPDGSVEFLDGRETAPAAAGGDWFLEADGSVRDRNAAIRSGLSVGVPGLVALAAEAHERHGALPWADLFAPAIALARDGFAVTPRLSGSLAAYPDRGARVPEGLALFYHADGSAPAAGEVVRLPALATTLEMIASEGPQAFYSGEFAASMAARIAADTPRGGGMTAADIAAYDVALRDPACILYRLYRVCTAGPPSSGGVALLAMLGQLEHFDLAALGLRNAATWHVFMEAQRLAYADREFYVADPAYVDVPLEGLLDGDYLAARAALIDPAHTMDRALPGRPRGTSLALAAPAQWPEQGTTHFVAVDATGAMASFNATVEGAFGSGLVHGGFYLNNELTDFSFRPAVNGRPVANAVAGGKRPASSMSPAVVYDPEGKPFFVVGAAGGGLIPVQTARAIVAVIDFGLPLEQALALPFVMNVGDDVVLVEKGTWMEALGPQFLALGHKRVSPFDQLLRTTGALHGEGGWQARMDPRLDALVRIPATAEGEAATDAGYSEGMSREDAERH